MATTLFTYADDLVRKSRIPTLLALVFALLALPAYALESGSTAPDFELSDTQGRSVRLSDYRGRIIVLKLATTWCPSCSEQMEELRDAQSFLAEKDVALVEVYLQETKEAVRAYAEKVDLRLPRAVLIDDGSAGRAYQVFTIPRVLVIDRDFRIVRDGNTITAFDLKNEIRRLLERS